MVACCVYYVDAKSREKVACETKNNPKCQPCLYEGWANPAIVPLYRYGDSPFAAFGQGDIHAHRVRGHQPGDFFRPFDKAILSRIEVFFVPHVKRLLLGLQSVKIKVINRPMAGGVFVHNRERRAGSAIADAQRLAYRFDERSFARAHAGIEEKYALALASVQDLLCRGWQALDVV